MSHLTVRSSYKKLTDRLNKHPLGAAPSETLFAILETLFSEKEADLVSKCPITPFTVEKVSKIWKKDKKETKKILDDLADRGMMFDMEVKGEQHYVLPPPMIGFFEFSLMRVTKDVDQKVLSELYHQYLHQEDDFVTHLFEGMETKIGRIFPNEDVIHKQKTLHVLDYDRVSEIITSASHIAVGTCYCRHKMEHLGKNCDAPMEVCLTLNSAGESLSNHNIAKTISKEEALDIIDLSNSHDLVQFGENAQTDIGFICNCCKCCCEALHAAREFAFLNPVATTNYIPKIDSHACIGCGKCVPVCPVDALSLEENEQKDGKKHAVLNEKICLGCAVCIKKCPVNAMLLVERKNKVITPQDSIERYVAQAIERGKLQNFIFDNQAMWNHRAMAALLGAIFKMPPIKQLMANKQIKSKFLVKYISKIARR